MAELATTLTYLTLAVIFFCVGVCSGRTLASKGVVTPVILVPGHGGSQADMKVERETPVQPGCPTSTNGWVHAWLNLWQLLPGNLDCWIDHYKMDYDPSSGEYSNVEGVSVRVPGWGQVETVEYLDTSLTAYILGNVGSYFAPVIQKLESWGYKRGANLVAAPYDFRYAPTNMPNYFEPLRELVEKMYIQNDNSKVALVSHSMGGLLTYYFLQKQTPEWKKKYVHSMTTLNTPWKGCVSMVEAMVSGYTWGFDGMHPNTFRTMQRACPSGVFFLPSPSEWGSEDVLLQTPNRNYTAADYNAMFDDIGYPVGKDMWNRINDEVLTLNNPGVDTWCLYSSGKDTPVSLVYEEGHFPDGPPTRVMGDGDGTANIHSASACTQWKDTFENLVVTKEFENTSHNGILTSEPMYAVLEDVLFV